MWTGQRSHSISLCLDTCATGVAQQALRNEQFRATAEFTIDNVEALPAYSQHSFEVPSDHMSLTDAESSSELEAGEEDRKAAEEESREAALRSFNHREQALRRANEIGLDRALAEVQTERERFLARVRRDRRE